MTLSIPDKTKVYAKRYVELASQTNWRMQVSSTVWFHFSAGWCAYSHGKDDSIPDCHQLQSIYWQRWMATTLPGVTSSFLNIFGVIMKHSIKYCKSYNSWSNENIWVLLPLQILKFWFKKPLSVFEKMHFSSGIFLATSVRLKQCVTHQRVEYELDSR